VAVTNAVFSGGTFTNLGSFSASGSTMVSGGTHEFAPAGTLNGLGSSLTVSAGALNLNSGEPVNVASFAEERRNVGWNGHADHLRTATWTGGFMDDAGTTAANGGLLINPINGGNVQLRFGER
jgi:hypothetical protein